MQRRRQAAQVGLRAAGAARVEKQRVEDEVWHGHDATVTRRMGYVDWHEEPGYWRDVTRHFPRDARLLDVGCGGAWIGDHFDDYTGIDVSPEAVEAARSRGRQVLLVDGDEPLPFDEESFDGVVLKDVLEHVANPVALVREVRRVLRPGGRVFASSPDAQRWVWDDYTHRRPFTRKSFRKLFEDQGLRVEQLGYESVMPGSGIVSGWTKRNRRPRLARPRSRGCRWCAATSGLWPAAEPSAARARRDHHELLARAGRCVSEARFAIAASTRSRRVPVERSLVREPALPDRSALAEHLKRVGRGGRRRLRLEAGVAAASLSRDARVKSTRWRGGSRPRQSQPKRRGPAPRGSAWRSKAARQAAAGALFAAGPQPGRTGARSRG